MNAPFEGNTHIHTIHMPVCVTGRIVQKNYVLHISTVGLPYSECLNVCALFTWILTDRSKCQFAQVLILVLNWGCKRGRQFFRVQTNYGTEHIVLIM